MTSWKAIRTLIIGAIFLAPVSAAQAVVVDFTSNDWSGVDGNSNFEGPGIITLSAGGDKMTFNDSDGAPGCGNGGGDLGSTGLDCLGDGIGIGDDEITQGGRETLTVSFKNDKGDSVKVNIHAIHLLDLFGRETSNSQLTDRMVGNNNYGKVGEIAVIDWGSTDLIYAHATGDNYPGGYWEVDLPNVLTMAAIDSFTLTGFDDHFSDYALARIEYSVVPVPAAFWMFGTALLGFVAMSRRTRV